MSHLRSSLPVFLLGLVAIPLWSIPANADETAIQKFFKDYVEAFNKQELETVVAMWTEKGLHVDKETGTRTEGRAAIRADLANVFKSPGKTRLSGTIKEVRMIKSDVANVEGTTTTTVENDKPSVSLFSAILIKAGDKWDPRSHQIRSWSFLADGSFGDNTWSKVDNDWIIKSSQTLIDGHAATGNYLLSRVDANKVTLKLMGHEIEGRPQPVSDPVTIVRLPAAPSTTQPSK
ncbi:MAG: SgcJ/EcaC family oxidoreductase [Pirellula sp.]